MASPSTRVRLGRLEEGSVAPAIMAIVDRGVKERPGLSNGLNAVIELDMGSRFPPVKIVFGGHEVLVEDGAAERPDLRVSGHLPDLVSLMVAPLVGGLPNPINARGRAALGMVAFRRVRIEGRLGLMRRFLGVIQL